MLRKKLEFLATTVFFLLFALGADLLGYSVSPLRGTLRIDGRLDEESWLQAESQSGFSFVQTALRKEKPKAQTSFKLLADQEALYVGITCDEPLMEELKAQIGGPSKNPWLDDCVEIFISPSGIEENYYQFVLSAGGGSWQQFYAEGGNIRPDPYAPLLEFACAKGDDSWSIELRLPFWALYMTDVSQWSDTWLFNICRERKPLSESSSWSVLENKFHEPKNFRKVSGLPKKVPAQDIRISRIEATLSSRLTNNLVQGELRLELNYPASHSLRAELEVDSPALAAPLKRRLSLAGREQYEFVFSQAEFKELGRHPFTAKLTQGGRLLYARSYPVLLDYAPLRLLFSHPQYARCYFPGQDCGRIAGSIEVNLPGARTVSLQVADKTYQLTVKDGRADFDLRQDLSPGTHQIKLTLPGSDEKLESSLRVLQKSSNMLWVENGRLLRNGKPIFYLDWYGPNWLMGKKYLEKYPAVSDRTPFNAGKQVTLMSKYLVRGLEQKEGTLDLRPAQELLDKIREIVEKNRDDPDVDYYYLSDEPECRGVSPVWLRHQYELIKELDPIHPVLIISRSPAAYLDCCDLMAPHPYINPRYTNAGERIYGRPVSDIRKMLREISDSARPDKVAMLCPSAFASNKKSPVYASFDEVLAMLWSAVATGCQGLKPYIHHEYISSHALAAAYDYCYFAFDRLAPWISAGKVLPIEQENPELSARLLLHEEVALLILANVTPNKQRARLQSDSLQAYPELLRFGEKGAQALNRGGFTAELKPFQTMVLSSRKLDEGMQSLAQCREGYENAEKARRENGNLLLDKYTEVEVNTSSFNANLGLGFQRSLLINGITDDLAWLPSWGQNPWYELSFPNFVPEFNQVRVHGAGLTGASLQIWKKGEWQTAEASSRKEDKYLLELNYAEKLRTVKLRINFVTKASRDFRNIELYEIELFEQK